MKCEFCSAANPTWLYPAESFDVGIGTRSIEDWAACEECHRLIDAVREHVESGRAYFLSTFGLPNTPQCEE